MKAADNTFRWVPARWPYLPAKDRTFLLTHTLIRMGKRTNSSSIKTAFFRWEWRFFFAIHCMESWINSQSKVRLTLTATSVSIISHFVISMIGQIKYALSIFQKRKQPLFPLLSDWVPLVQLDCPVNSWRWIQHLGYEFALANVEPDAFMMAAIHAARWVTNQLIDFLRMQFRSRLWIWGLAFNNLHVYRVVLDCPLFLGGLPLDGSYKVNIIKLE